MAISIFRSLLVLLPLISAVVAQSTDDGYTGYKLTFEPRDTEDVVYETASTPANASPIDSPDVYLNASVSVGEISILVANLTAKVNLDAQVLSLLYFNAGVTASVDRISLLIQNVSAKVTLEARLGNLVTMISSVLDSIDLNPIIATLGNNIGDILNTTTGAISDLTGGLTARSYKLDHGILYSVNDYHGNTHTNRVLTQTGAIVDEFLDNSGTVHSATTVGSYLTDMTFNGHNSSAVFDGQAAFELEYVYDPFPGVSSVCAIFVDENGAVIGTQVLSESNGGGTSTVGDL